MADTKKSPAEVMLRNVRLSYPNLWKAKGFGDGTEGEPKFSAVALMDPDDKQGKVNIAKIEDAIDFVKKEKWPKGAPKLGPQKICLRDGEDLEEMKDGYEGMMYVTASDAKRPRVLDADGIDVRDGDEGAPYAGCRVDMKIRVWAQDNKYGKRINASLVAVKFRDDDDAFGAAPFDASEFDEDDDDEAPRRSSKGRDSDRGSRRGRDDDEDEKPRSRRSSRDDDDEDEKPRGRRSSRDDDEDEKPRSRRGRDDDEDEKPRSRRSSRDDDDEDEKPRSRRSSRDDDDDGDERRSSRRGRDDDEDEKPRSRRRDLA
jgi:hypothetical protein